MNKNKIFIGSGIVLAIILVVYFSLGSSEAEANLVVEVEQGEFVVDIMTSGALEAKNSNCPLVSFSAKDLFHSCRCGGDSK